jgi:hypothetical protein
LAALSGVLSNDRTFFAHRARVSSDFTFDYTAKPLFISVFLLSQNPGAKSLFDKRKWVDGGWERTYSGARWKKVGQSGRNFARNRRSDATGEVAGEQALT